MTTSSSNARKPTWGVVGMRGRVALVAAMVLVLFAVGVGNALATHDHEYSVGTENSADYGSQVKRIDKATTCPGSGAGFVFNDMWQGTENDESWIEVGTSFCDWEDDDAKWIYAEYSSGVYWEAVLKWNTSLANHTMKIININSSGRWDVIIDGTLRAIVYNMVGFNNSTDVGLEVTPSRMNSVQPAVYNRYLRYWYTRSSSNSWAGEDACRRTDNDFSGKWISANKWRTTLNTSGYSNSSCNS